VGAATRRGSTRTLTAFGLSVRRRQREKGQGTAFPLIGHSPVLAVNHPTAW
jgi:hypothetical protein